MSRAKFNLSNYKLLTCNQGQLVPVGITEVLPGDTFQQSTSAFIRLQPMLAPVMHPVHTKIHHWFVPFRLIWEDWENFITGGEDGLDDSEYPTIDFPSGGPEIGTLADYLGIPTDMTYAQSVSALPFRAYSLIWNEWYRDQQLQTKLVVDKTSGNDTTTNTTLQNVCWGKDYFTESRPQAQLGPEVSIPMAATSVVPTHATNANPVFQSTGDTTSRSLTTTNAATTVTWNVNGNEGAVATWKDPKLAAVGGTINDLREAFAIMRYEEARAQFGARYTEYLRYNGVKSSDARLQRPEYLGGGKQTIQFSEVLQTSNDVTETGEDPTVDETVGQMRGHGIGAVRSNRYRRFFEEHGYVITLMSTQPITMYTQGLNKMFIRRTKFDHFQKELQHIGQEEIQKREILAADDLTQSQTFGWNNRYQSYRQGINSIAGQFRSTLNYWHMSRIFSAAPTLNAAFVSSNPTNRIYADTTSDQLLCMVQNRIVARRMHLAPKGGSNFVR